MATYDIALIWNPVNVPDFDHYNIGRSAISGGPYTLIGQSTKPAYIDKDMPEGYLYYYVVTAVDKLGNESTPSAEIVKSSPPEFTPPLTPTQLKINRSKDLQSVELNWEENVNPFATPNPERDIAGYLVYRVSMDNPSGTIVIGELVAITSANKFIDSAIPFSIDTTYKMTWVYYIIYAYDKYYNTSAGLSSSVLTIPTASNMRGIVDYLSINLYWELPLPEQAAVTNIYPVVYVGTTWYRGAFLDSAGVSHQAIAYYPMTVARLDGYLNAIGTFVPFVKGSLNLISVSLDKGTHGALKPQEIPIVVEIPDYEQDTIAPEMLYKIEMTIDAMQNMGYLIWARRQIDDDLMYYEISYCTTYDTYYEIIATTSQNTFTLRELNKFTYGGENTPYVRIRIVPVDRSGNRGEPCYETFCITPHITTEPITIHTSCIENHAKITGIWTSAIWNYYYIKVELSWVGIDKYKSTFKQFVVYVSDNITIDYTDPNLMFFLSTVERMTGCILKDTATLPAKPWDVGVKRWFNIGIMDTSNIIHVDDDNKFKFEVVDLTP